MTSKTQALGRAEELEGPRAGSIYRSSGMEFRPCPPGICGLPASRLPSFRGHAWQGPCQTHRASRSAGWTGLMPPRSENTARLLHENAGEPPETGAVLGFGQGQVRLVETRAQVGKRSGFNRTGHACALEAAVWAKTCSPNTARAAQGNNAREKRMPSPCLGRAIESARLREADGLRDRAPSTGTNPNAGGLKGRPATVGHPSASWERPKTSLGLRPAPG